MERLLHRAALLVALLLACSAPARASAQCAARSTQCRDCHETKGAHPVLALGSPWHRDHAFGDFCSECHGGDPDAKDAAVAHVGLVSPMSDVQSSCAKCHEPGKVEHAYSSASAVVRAAAKKPAAAGAAKSPVSERTGNLVLTSVIVLIALGGGSYVARNERKLRTSASSIKRERKP